ncbi:hypothetical protein HPB49_016387 [Dermacentor silvarum]|uniref:Uncharacterized protein n=1 Tax=Dermacentor silvarum TaxID=543639 RepID=A0ACB8DJY5_DERSI|nr:hypothetical protein HPB49_016387 [Dermacentor silvarum]
MAVAAKAGNDPSTTQWLELEATEAWQDPIPGEDEYLQIIVRRMQEKLAKMNPTGSVAAAQQQARKPGLSPAAGAASDSPRRGGQLAQWKLTQAPRIRPDELVIVLKPRINMDLRAAFGPGGIGTAVQDLTGSTANAGVSVWPVWDQNIVVVGVNTEALVSRLIGDVTLTIPPNTANTVSWTFKIRWRNLQMRHQRCRHRNLGILSAQARMNRPRNPVRAETRNNSHRRVQGMSRCIRFIHYCSENVRYYKKAVPACYQCGTLGHRADA